jgi:hypothetical protein
MAAGTSRWLLDSSRRRNRWRCLRGPTGMGVELPLTQDSTRGRAAVVFVDRADGSHFRPYEHQSRVRIGRHSTDAEARGEGNGLVIPGVPIVRRHRFLRRQAAPRLYVLR